MNQDKMNLRIFPEKLVLITDFYHQKYALMFRFELKNLFVINTGAPVSKETIYLQLQSSIRLATGAKLWLLFRGPLLGHLSLFLLFCLSSEQLLQVFELAV